MARPRADAIKIVGHDIDPIEGMLDLRHFGVLEIFAACAGDGEGVTVRAGSFAGVAQFVELRAKVAQHGGKVLFIFSAKLNAGAGLARVFPIEIDSVERVKLQDVEATAGEFLTRLIVEGRVGKVVCAPTADGENNFE